MADQEDERGLLANDDPNEDAPSQPESQQEGGDSRPASADPSQHEPEPDAGSANPSLHEGGSRPASAQPSQQEPDAASANPSQHESRAGSLNPSQQGSQPASRQPTAGSANAPPATEENGAFAFTSDGEVKQLDTVASAPLVFPDFKQEFEKLRLDAQKVFDMRDYEKWLDQELEPHAVDVGELTMARDMKTMAEAAERDDDEKIMQRAKELGTRLEEAKDHVAKYFNLGKEMEVETQWRLREEEVAARERVVFEHQAREAALLSDLNSRYGVLQKVPTDPFSWTVEWKFAPQEFTVNVTSLRGLRSKVRPGYYVVLCSVVDRVGGATIRFSTGERTLDCNAPLPPMRVNSRSRDVDKFINQSVELKCPSPLLLQTHAVLQFELWQLRLGSYDPVDKVVGFGYWPLVGQDMRVREGKFKVPMVVGEPDESVDTFRQIDSLMNEGLQYWLGNIYFEIKHVQRNRDDEENDIEENDLGDFGNNEVDTGDELRLKKTAGDIRALKFPHLPPRLFFDDVKLDDEGEKRAAKGDLRDMNSALWEKRALLEQEKQNLRSEMFHRKNKSLVMDTNDDEEITEMKMRNELHKEGKTERVLPEFVEADGYDNGKSRDSHVLVQQHHFALASQREFFFMGRRFRDKMAIAVSVVFYDFGVNKGGPWDKSKVVMNLVFLIIGLIVRGVIHNVAKFLFLGFLDVPVTHQSWAPWHIDIRFDHTSRFYPWDTAGTMAIGFAICIAFFMFMTFSFFLLLMIFEKIPYNMTRFALWFGICTCFDPILTSIAEVAAGNTASGDPFLLYNQFEREEGTGVHGAVLTSILYGFMLIPHVICMGWFAIYVHLNGRAVDMYRRLVYPESSFFMPHDLELGKPELAEIVKRAKSYRADEGATIRRIMVEDLNSHYVDMFRERLFSLLNIDSDVAETWINEYFDSIALRRPRSAEGRVVDNLGSFELGSDVLLFMKRNFPHLCMYTRHMVGDRDEDHYYESDLIRGISSHSTALEDDKEMRDFLKAYFLAQVHGEKPVRWHPDGDDSFEIRDRDLLADLIFFETSYDTHRMIKLRNNIERNLQMKADAEKARGLEPEAQNFGVLQFARIDPENEETWVRISMLDFERGDRFRSIQGDPAEGKLVIMSTENVGMSQSRRERLFVVTPDGAVFEPTESSFTFQTHHTADHIEFWAAKALLRGKELDEHYGKTEESVKLRASRRKSKWE